MSFSSTGQFGTAECCIRAIGVYPVFMVAIRYNGRVVGKPTPGVTS